MEQRQTALRSGLPLGVSDSVAPDDDLIRRMMFEQCPDLLCVVRLDGTIAAANEEWTRVLGWEPEELVDTYWPDHAHPEDRKQAVMVLKRLSGGAYVRGLECRWSSRDGEHRWLSWNAHGDPEGKLIFAVARDVTAERRAEELGERQHALETLVTTTAARLVASTSGQLLEGVRRSLREVGELLGVEGTFVFIAEENRDGLWRLAEWLRSDSSIEIAAIEHLPREDVEALLLDLARPDRVMQWSPGSPAPDAPGDGAFRVLRHAGALRGVLIPLSHSGSVMGMLGLVSPAPERDWFEAEFALLRVLGELFASSLKRRAIETELLESKERFRNIVQESPMGMHMYELHADGTLVLLDANPAAERITGIGTPSVVGRTLGEAFPHLAASDVADRLQLAAALGIPWQTTNLTFEDGSESAILEMYAFQTSPCRAAAMFLDVTNRKATESALRTSEQRLRAVFDAATNVAFVITDAAPEPSIIEASPGAERTFGYRRGELVGEPLRRLLVPDSDTILQHSYARMRDGGEGFAGEMTLVRHNGELFPALVRTNPLTNDAGAVYGVLIVGLDVSEQRQLETFLQQSQKMEALGTLAGGIAHDFNNILGAVIGYSELARMNLPQESPIAGHLDQVLTAANRARDLVAQILAFSRRGDQKMRPLELGPIVREALRMLRASIPTTVDIRHRVSREARAVRANPTQVHQVLMNLCTNAAHAMRDQGGVLQIEVAPEVLDEDAVADLPDCAPGTYVKLTVRDTGHGIDPATLGRIFDPYFTTKEKGVGTGLGLAVVHGIIKACNGGIQVASEVGVGTVIDVYLPQIDEPTSGETLRPTPLPMGTERILFVDDEEALVITTRRMLERLGYRVTVSISSRDALERFTRRPDSFDLVITDQTMPQLTGDQLARRMLELRPQTPIILCTGFSETMTEEKALEIGITSYLMKPLVMRTLATTVRAALDRTRS